MLELKIKAAKGSFFDRPRVMKKVDKAKREALSKLGRYIRVSARQSIKRAPYLARKERGKERTDHRRQASLPGKPPYSQTGFLKKFIYYVYDKSRDSVVIGPARLNRGSGNAPATLEAGGTAKVTRYRKGKKVRRKVKIEPRPYMGPALVANRDEIPNVWRNSVKGP